MKIIILFITLFVFTSASSFKYSNINMEIDFQLSSKNKKTKILKYYNNFAIYYDEGKKFTEKLFCFNAPKKINVSKNTKKSKYKICLDKNNKSHIYVIDKNFRYQKVEGFNVELKKIILNVKDKKLKKSCNDKAYGFDSLTDKINNCLQKI